MAIDLEVSNTPEPKAPEAKAPETNTEVEYTPTEQRAMEQGWKPKDQFEGDEGDFRGAREFLDRGELLRKISSQGEEMRELKKIAGTLSEHNKQVYVAGYKKAINDLRAAKARAINDGNGQAVAQLETRIDETKEELAKIEQISTPQVQQQEGPTPAYTQFVEGNEWYRTDNKLRNYSHGYAIEYAKQHPRASEGEIYEAMNREVRKEFPEKFGRKTAPTPDGAGSRGSSTGSDTRKSGTGDFEKLMGRLPDEHARVARDMVKRGLMTKEKYVQDYLAIENRS